MISILDSAVSGITRAETSAAVVAADVSRTGEGASPEPDVAKDFVTLSLASAQVVVSGALATTSQDTTQSLLDIIA